MTLEEAKEFYFRYYGSSFHMDREEPAEYNSFRMLDPGPGVLKQWDEELLDGLFDRLHTDPARIWSVHGTILQIIRRNNCDAERYLNRLLEETARMEDPDDANVTLITENMAGRNELLSDGGVYVFCRYSGLSKRMNDIMEQMIAAHSALYQTDKRFASAVHRYRKAYRKWSGSSFQPNNRR